MAIAGRVAIVPKGDWSADATYKRLDAVTHNNTLYFAKKDVPAGTETSNTEYWSKSVVGGEATVDDTISSESTNPVQNKVVKAYVDKKASENVDFSTSTSKLLNGSIEAQLVLSNATRNLLNPIAVSESSDGITYTKNSDGSYTLNGTATNLITIVLAKIDMTQMTEPVKLVGCPINGSDSTYKLSMIKLGSDQQNDYNGNGVVIDNEKLLKASEVEIRIVVYKGTTVTNLVFKPMLTTDLDATYDDFVPYSGYDIKTCGKNLLNPTLQTTTQNGVTCTNNGDGTYTLNGTASNYTYFHLSGIITNKNIINKCEGSKLVGAPSGSSYESFFLYAQFDGGQSTQRLYLDYGNGTKLNNIKGCETLEFIICVMSGKTVSNLTFKPMLITDISATYDDFESYKDGGTVHIDSTTKFPLLGLKSFDGETNIISPGNVEVTYAKSDSGKAILDMSENKLDKDNVVNNQTTTEAGFALDARQANPNLDGTLAKQLSDLNGSLKIKNVQWTPYCPLTDFADKVLFKEANAMQYGSLVICSIRIDLLENTPREYINIVNLPKKAFRGINQTNMDGKAGLWYLDAERVVLRSVFEAGTYYFSFIYLTTE